MIFVLIVSILFYYLNHDALFYMIEYQLQYIKNYYSPITHAYM